jgi:DNA-binding GntR family transcriptional regulator
VPISEIFWTEALVEGFAGQLLAESCTRDQIRRLKANLRATEKVSGDLDAQQELLVQFHELVIDFLPVTALQLLCKMIRNVVNDAIATYALGAAASTERRTSTQAHTIEDHAKFLEMLTARDSLAAGKFWREHLTASAAAMQDLIRASATALDLPLSLR